MVTREIAEELDRRLPKSLGKNLSRLVKMGVLDNERGGTNGGYGLAALGHVLASRDRDAP